MAKKKKKRGGFSWQGALAGLGGHMQQQARMQAQMQNQMALEQMRAQREAERYRTLDAQAQRTYELQKKNAEGYDLYRQALIKDLRDDNTFQRDKWKAEQDEIAWKKQQLMKRAGLGGGTVLPPVPLPGGAPGAQLPGGAPPPVAPDAQGQQPQGAAPAPAPLPAPDPVLAAIAAQKARLEAARQTVTSMEELDTIDTNLGNLSLKEAEYLHQQENDKRERARQRQRDLLDTHERLFDMSNKIKGGGKDEDTDLTTGDLDFGMAIEQRKRDPMNKRKSLVAKLNDLYANNDGKEKTQKQIADLEKQIADFDKAAGGSVPDPQTFYNTARAYKTGQVPPALAADTTGSGTLMSHPGARAALEQGENPDVVRRALEIMQQGR